MQYWMDHQNHLSAGTPIDCSCLICSGIAENDKVVAMEDFIDVGNILGKIWVSLFQSVVKNRPRSGGISLHGRGPRSLGPRP